MDRAPVLSTLGAVGSAIASALCCIGPLLYVSLGVGAGLASTFEPLRPWFLGGAVLFLGLGFYDAYGRRRPRCAPDGDAERKRARERTWLWVGAFIVILFATFPTWSTWLT